MFNFKILGKVNLVVILKCIYKIIKFLGIFTKI